MPGGGDATAAVPAPPGRTAPGPAAVDAGILAASVLTPSSPFLGKGGSIVHPVLIEEISLFIAVLFTLVGIVYGRSAGTVKSASEVPKLMAEGVQQTAPVIVLLFAVSQFLACFEWTGIGSVITVEGAGLLRSLDAPHLAILLAVILAVSLLNMLITSWTAQWAVLARSWCPWSCT